MDFSNLRGEIRKKFSRQAEFAVAIGMSPASLSAKLNGKSQWQSGEIARACEVLNIPYAEAPDYFFTPKVEFSQHVNRSCYGVHHQNN